MFFSHSSQFSIMRIETNELSFCCFDTKYIYSFIPLKERIWPISMFFDNVIDIFQIFIINFFDLA
jgi:hypothetical protein